MTVRKRFANALHNVICFNLIFFSVSLDCENLLKRFLVLNPTKRSRLEVGIYCYFPSAAVDTSYNVYVCSMAQR